jgi:NAD(P)H-flavin reductase
MTMLKSYLNSDNVENSIFYICGPPIMVEAMRNIFEQDHNQCLNVGSRF